MPHREEDNYPKAFLISSLIVGLFFLASYFIIIREPFEQEEIGYGGIIVNYGTTIEGKGADYMRIEEPSVNPEANHTQTEKVEDEHTPEKNPSAETSNKDLVVQDDEDAPSVSKKNNKNTTPVTLNKTPKETKPTLNPNALYKGPKNNGQSAGDGTSDKPGNQGSLYGDPLSTNYGEGGSGAGKVSLSLANRTFTRIPKIEDDGQSSGKVVVAIQVDRTGEITFARAGAKGTTISDLMLWRKCETSVLGARLNRLESAPDIQFGSITFNFKVK